jgi:hypothetical protein
VQQVCHAVGTPEPCADISDEPPADSTANSTLVALFVEGALTGSILIIGLRGKRCAIGFVNDKAGIETTADQLSRSFLATAQQGEIPTRLR